MENGKNGTIGRILSATPRTARIEFLGDLKINEGDFICFKRDGESIVGRIDKLVTHRYAGLTGYVYWLEPLDSPPRPMQNVYIAEEDKEDGFFFVGTDRAGNEIRLNLNPFFNHAMIGGMTQQGKTHLCIILLEEMIMRGVPCFIIDSHGEFVNLGKATKKWKHAKNVVVVEDLRIEDLIAHLQQKHTVVYNLLGLPKVSKASRVGEILHAFMEAKERDYAKAENQPMLLEILPTLVFVDEAEIYAPNQTSTYGAKGESRDALITIAKEGAKFGLGLVIVPQRVTKLDVDVRGQCNSAAIFRVTDFGSRQAVKKMDFITPHDIRNLGAFTKGICLLSGQFVKRPRIIFTRELMSEKVKKVNFEEMLGIETEPPIAVKSRFITDGARIVDTITGDVVEDPIAWLRREDLAATELEEGDGVVLRGQLTPSEEDALNELAVLVGGTISEVDGNRQFKKTFSDKEWLDRKMRK